MRQYDYIIAGTGCAGLSLAVHLIESGLHKNKKILLADRTRKAENDRTWCFWEKKPGLFEPALHKTWQQLTVQGRHFGKTENIAPYCYKMIRGADFYAFCKEKISLHPEFEWQFGEITAIQQNSLDTASLSIDKEKFEASYIFSSIIPETLKLGRSDYYLLQHFQGNLIETENPVFDEKTAVLMDFQTPQEMDTAFVYTLPLSSRKALIEYTVFSREQYADASYETALKSYIAGRLHINNYKVLEIEKGTIPMTNFNFPRQDGNIVYIGLAGGLAKPSSGYTFQFIQEDSREIISWLKGKSTKRPIQHRGRFLFYDSVLLHILFHQRAAGRELFERLFEKNKISDILCFLENKTNLLQELKIISRLQKLLFIKAALRFFLKLKP